MNGVSKKSIISLVGRAYFLFFKSVSEAYFLIRTENMARLRATRQKNGGAAPTKRYLYTMEKKEEIVVEAYCRPNNVKRTSKKYAVQPTAIRQWKRRIAKLKRDLDVTTYDRIKKNSHMGPAHPHSTLMYIHSC